MRETPQGGTVIEAELRLPAATVQVWQFDLVKPMHSVLRDDDAYRIDMCLSPRLPGSGLCFADHWASHRFERPGRIFMIPPRETLHVRGGVGHQGAIICYLPLSPLRDAFEDDLEWTDRRLEASLDIASTSIGNLLYQLGEEARHPGFASEVLSEAIALQIAVHLQRYYRGFTESHAPGGLAPWRLRLIEERLKDVGHAPTLSELAALCRLSARQLSRGFRASRGISLGEYVAQQRIETAKAALRARGSVKSIAYTLGFASPSSFCFAFRKATGMAPGVYRLEAKKGLLF